MATTPYRDSTLEPPVAGPWWRAVPWRHVAIAGGLLVVTLAAGANRWISVASVFPVSLTILVLGGWALPRWAYLAIRRRRIEARAHRRRTLVWAMYPILFLGMGTVVRRFEDQRLVQVVEALDRYRQINGQWPAQLTDLVPTILPRLPCAHVCGAQCRYHYEAPNEYEPGPVLARLDDVLQAWHWTIPSRNWTGYCLMHRRWTHDGPGGWDDHPSSRRPRFTGPPDFPWDGRTPRIP